MGQGMFLDQSALRGMLGIGKSTLWRWLRDGRLPQGRQIGRKRYWLMSEIEKFFGE